jgi:Ca2+-binding RTX toxin-like protein
MSPMPLRRHLTRLAAGVSVAAATSALTLLAAAPAQAATPVTVTKALGTVMRINGSDGQESLRLTVFNGAVTVSNTLGSVQAGSGCVQLGAAVKCDGVSSVGYNGNGGDDSFRNDTSLLVSANGGAGDDRYTGGPGQDRFRGGLGSDIVNGGNGSDFCDAETESACELDFPPPPKVRVP